MFDYKSFGTNILAIRISKGYAREHVENESGVSIKTIYRIEKGLTEPSPYTLQCLSFVYKMDLNELWLRYQYLDYEGFHGLEYEVHRDLCGKNSSNFQTFINTYKKLYTDSCCPFYKTQIQQIIKYLEGL